MAAFSSPSPITGRWESVDCAETQKGSVVPCQRSLHAGAVWKDNFIVFGGYDGARRVNDLYQFGFKTNLWTLLTSVNAPTARDRHVAVVYENSLYIFGGFDGVARVNGKPSIPFFSQTPADPCPCSPLARPACIRPGGSEMGAGHSIIWRATHSSSLARIGGVQGQHVRFRR